MSYSQAQNQALFNEYLDTLHTIFFVRASSSMAVHCLNKIHTTLSKEHVEGAVVSGKQAHGIRCLIKQLKFHGFDGGYKGEVLEKLQALAVHFPPTYESDFGTAYSLHSHYSTNAHQPRPPAPLKG